MPLKIGIDLTCLSNDFSGARLRAIKMVIAMAEVKEKFNVEIFLAHGVQIKEFTSLDSRFKIITTNVLSGNRYLRLVTSVNFWLYLRFFKKFDIFEFWSMPVYAISAKKTLFTIHDVRLAQGQTSYLNRLINFRSLKKALGSVDTVVTVSKSIKSELENIDPNAKVAVVKNYYNMPSTESFPPKNFSESKFILSVGHFEPRKNLQTLILSYYRSEARNQGIKLILVGNNNGTLGATIDLINVLALQREVLCYPSVSETNLSWFYRNCELVIFPSLYEGFGIPILEATIYRKPLVVSDIPVFREILGNGGVFFSPLSIVELSSSLDRVSNLGVDSKAELVRKASVACKGYFTSRAASRFYSQIIMDSRL